MTNEDRQHLLFLPTWLTYPLSIALPALTLFIAINFDLTSPTKPFIVVFAPSICIATMLGGFWPGIISAAISSIGLAYYVIPPEGSFHVDSTLYIAQLLVLFITALAVYIPRAALARAFSAISQDRQLLRAATERLSSLIDATPVGIVVLDHEGVIQICNSMAARIIDGDPDKIVGLEFTSIPWKAFRPDGTMILSAEQPPAMSLASGQPCRDTLMRVTTLDGREKWLSMNVEIVEVEDVSKSRSAIVIMDDVTERIRSEQIHNDVERILLHDIKSPLINLFSMAQMVKMDSPGIAADDLVHQIEHAIKQALFILDSTNKIKDMEEGTYKPLEDAVSLSMVVDDVLGGLGALATQRDVRLACRQQGKIEDGEHTCLGERPLLEDMFTNLVKNAVEASPKGGTVEVVLSQGDGKEFVSINNAGAVADIVRDDFFGKRVTAGKASGTGLGTYSANLIARSHGGSISMESSEDAGTSVTVTLPAFHARLRSP